MAKKNNIIERVGAGLISFWKGVKRFHKFNLEIFHSFKSLKYMRFRSVNEIIFRQTGFTGIDAFPFIVFVAALIGGTVIIQSMTKFPKFGIESFIGDLLVIIVARELGPLITALIIISRSGSAITAEIATQKENKELLSMEIMGIDTKLYIVFPRIVASILSLFSLIVIFDLVAFIGGYLISQLTIDLDFSIFIKIIFDSLSFSDLVATFIKSISFGVIIPWISCYYGFMPKSKFEVPIYVSRGVIRTLIVIFVLNAIISTLFYL